MRAVITSSLCAIPCCRPVVRRPRDGAFRYVAGGRHVFRSLRDVQWWRCQRTAAARQRCSPAARRKARLHLDLVRLSLTVAYWMHLDLVRLVAWDHPIRTGIFMLMRSRLGLYCWSTCCFLDFSFRWLEVIVIPIGSLQQYLIPPPQTGHFNSRQWRYTLTARARRSIFLCALL